MTNLLTLAHESVHKGLTNVSRSIDVNRDVIIDYWNGVIDFDEVKPRLQQVQP